MRTVREVFSGLQLRIVLNRYCACVWGAWKAIKAKALADPKDPFLGGPQALLDRGITEVIGLNGPIPVTAKTRIRFQQLGVEGLKQLGLLDLHGVVTKNLDVVHPEYVGTFEECVAVDVKHWLNNAVAASAVLDMVVSFLADEKTTMDELALRIRNVLAGKDEAGAKMIGAGVRAAWLGRACQDGSWETSSDFVFYQNLTTDVASIDPYVANPVLTYFLADLTSGFYTNS